jgi:hypothetical protein
VKLALTMFAVCALSACVAVGPEPTPTATPEPPCVPIPIVKDRTPTQTRDAFGHALGSVGDATCVALGAQVTPFNIHDALDPDGPGTIEGGPNISQLLAFKSYIKACDYEMNAAEYSALMALTETNDEAPWAVSVWSKTTGSRSAGDFCRRADNLVN